MKSAKLSKVDAESHDKSARLDAIKRIIRARAVGTQEDLGKLLHAEGFKVTQGTLSRDLQQLGALRVPRQGGTVYELGPEPEPVQRLRALGELVLFISDNEALAVVRTQPGAANAVARAIDLARIPECLGSIAGDDTIFLTPVRGVGARRLSHALRELLGDAGARS
jgi:transcriptional regulator of arginine metabolism